MPLWFKWKLVHEKMGQNMLAFYWRELSQYGGHENKVRNEENCQIRNFKEDSSESFLMEEEQSGKCNKCYNNTFFSVIKPQVFLGLLLAPLLLAVHLKTLPLEELTGLRKTWGRHLLIFTLCSLRSLIIPQKCQVLVTLLATEHWCDTKSCETKSKIPQGMGSTYQWK